MKKYVWLFFVLFTTSLFAQKKNENFKMHIKKSTGAIKIDGVLDEPVWSSASQAKDFHKKYPNDIGEGVEIAKLKIRGKEIDLNNPESFANAINQGLFTPEESETQKAALIKLEVALALIDGWVDEVVTTAAGERLPNLEKLRETLRRHRATNAPTKQLFSSLLGLEVSPRLAREASAFWRSISELSNISTRDKIWSGILPTQEELLNPQLYLASVEVPDDLSGLL